MALPTKAEQLALDVIYNGSPFVKLVAKESILTSGLDVIHNGAPFVAQGGASTTTTTTTPWLSPTSSTGGAWTNPGNILSSNNAFATQTIAANNEGGGLFAIGFSGLTVPAGATTSSRPGRSDATRRGSCSRPDSPGCVRSSAGFRNGRRNG